MYSSLGEHKKLGVVVEKARLLSKSAVNSPWVVGVIHECSGKMAMAGRKWEFARVEFNKAFESFEEAGNVERTLACLNYLLLSSMLASSRISPFDAQNTKSYERNPAIGPLAGLTKSYLDMDYGIFNKVIAHYPTLPSADPYILTFLPELLASMRASVALKIVTSYSRVPVSFVARELGEWCTITQHSSF